MFITNGLLCKTSTTTKNEVKTGIKAETRNGLVEDGDTTQGRSKGMTTMRTVTEVLMMGGAIEAPTTRRKVKAKRGSRKAATLGKIKDYFPNVQLPKERKLEETCVRKRKFEPVLEDLDWSIGTNPRRPRLMETTKLDVETNSWTLSPILWGPKSLDGREPGQGLFVGATKGLDLIFKEEEQGRNSRGNFDMTGNL